MHDLNDRATIEAVAEDLEWMLETGECASGICRRLDLTAATLLEFIARQRLRDRSALHRALIDALHALVKEDQEKAERRALVDDRVKPAMIECSSRCEYCGRLLFPDGRPDTVVARRRRVDVACRRGLMRAERTRTQQEATEARIERLTELLQAKTSAQDICADLDTKPSTLLSMLYKHKLTGESEPHQQLARQLNRLVRQQQQVAA